MDLTTHQKKELKAAVDRGAAFLDQDRPGWRVESAPDDQRHQPLTDGGL